MNTSRGIFSPNTFPNLFNFWNRFPEAVIIAGATELLHFQAKRIPEFPETILLLDRMEELQKIDRTERFLELGAMVSLSRIASLGKIVPTVLLQCINEVADIYIQNLATIGGNIACNGDLIAPLVALGASYEIRSGTIPPRRIPASRFLSIKNELKSQELISRVLIPFEQWDYAQFRKFHDPTPDHPSVLALLLARVERDILTDLRVAVSGTSFSFYHDREKCILVSERLPIKKRDIRAFMESWKNSPATLEALKDNTFQNSIINFIYFALLSGLSE
ncbi:MAG: FAD binding domain-containing protein [Treponema sp.]|jgi:CO/xanthine dehydrogenase FAD-binding subunit|nr:FAD binding domain-containing protein [Treponema sp.]